MQDRRRLRVIGITYNQIESGVYALILQEDEGTVRIPIIIGYPEAQSIECRLQDIATPRPLTHDVMARMLEEFNMRLLEVEIRKLPNGVFAADLLIEDSLGQQKTIDSRSSDAVALALRCNAPIYTSQKVLDEAGFTADEPGEGTSAHSGSTSTSESTVERHSSKPTDPSDSATTILRRMSINELNRAMEQAVEKEDYESAARIKTELDRRKNA